MDDALHNLALLEIDLSLRAVGNSAVEHGLPQAREVRPLDRLGLPQEVRGELSGHDREILHTVEGTSLPAFNPEQWVAFDVTAVARDSLITGTDGYSRSLPPAYPRGVASSSMDLAEPARHSSTTQSLFPVAGRDESP